VHIEYAPADEKRQNIPWVRYERNGDRTTFRAEGFKDADLPRCHSAPWTASTAIPALA